MFVCLSVGYTLLIKPNSIHMLYIWEEVEFIGKVPIEKLTQSQQCFSVYERKRNSHIFLPRFSYLTSLLMESLTTCILLYICNKYKRFIESLTTYILLYICNKYKRLIKCLTRYISLYICNQYKSRDSI